MSKTKTSRFIEEDPEANMTIRTYEEEKAIWEAEQRRKKRPKPRKS